jgi:hypothetical protein
MRSYHHDFIGPFASPYLYLKVFEWVRLSRAVGLHTDAIAEIS